MQDARMMLIFSLVAVVFICCTFQLNGYLLTISRNPSRRFTKLATSPHSADRYELCLNSPCKINLFLRILGRRPSGYHDLASLFQAVSLYDRLSFQRCEGNQDVLTCSDPTLSTDGNNLVTKALDLMRRKTGIAQYFRVYLDKKIPMQAGLGGGSGNAATAMFAFNQLTHRKASEKELLEWSGEIGSDISFFFSSGTAYCTGRGEIVQAITPLPDAVNIKVHLFKPQDGLSTPLVFKTLDLSHCNSDPPERILNAFQRIGILSACRNNLLINDLERPAFTLLPKLQQLKLALTDARRDTGNRILGEMMSGSGTTVFALTDSSINDSGPIPWVREILSRFSDVQYYSTSFVQRDQEGWYD